MVYDKIKLAQHGFLIPLRLIRNGRLAHGENVEGAGAALPPQHPQHKQKQMSFRNVVKNLKLGICQW